MKTELPELVLPLRSMELDIPMERDGSSALETRNSGFPDFPSGCSLPDVVLQSSPANTRRSRSVSVNIPPQEVVFQTIGARLRRLSEEFERTHVDNVRRRTIGSGMQLNGNS